ncbi:hypothetical protein GCM10011391_39140 [Pullulanibacillus camelliae]|uniref:Uncharacterized protein n=1 Tax=Pullulanibacillus camelliae TaxID=1707096 RepID=A0A8J2YNS4_9BACL|nr:hypothetical protein [Pullulanibacillus camelliae]GGE56323.1 hypothetical protein GCM10011391_39140 [Pullulanibacillus camelliae]
MFDGSHLTEEAQRVAHVYFNHKKVVQYLHWRKDNSPLHKERRRLKKKILFGLVTVRSRGMR